MIMPVPRLVVPAHKVNEKWFKVNYIVRTLVRAGYDIGDAREAIQIIESENLDKSQFDYPYASYDEFKKHVLLGEFDIDVDSMIMINKKTPEQIREEQINQMLHQLVVQSRMQVSSNSSVKKSLSRKDVLNRLSRKFESSENMQQSDDYKHDGFS